MTVAGLTFFFDPLCPWSWRTSVWIREVQRLQQLPVEWRFFSLALANDYLESFPDGVAPLRVAALAGREAGNEAVGKVYLAIGTALHEEGADAREPGIMGRVIPPALEREGLDPTLFERAMSDPATLAEVERDHTLAKERYAAFGVPWLVLEGHDLGFFGPVVDVPPQDREAIDLWEHTAWMITRPYLYELKRDRP
jgi:protein-disulfide isomerase-like protein with CxxC motif